MAPISTRHQMEKMQMKPENPVALPMVSLSVLKGPMLVGATIALILIVLFLLGVNDPDPAWGRFWMVRPLLIVPVAGAAGAVASFYVRHLLFAAGWNKGLLYILGFFIYVVALWMGTVLGLDGTLWN